MCPADDDALPALVAGLRRLAEADRLLRTGHPSSAVAAELAAGHALVETAAGRLRKPGRTVRIALLGGFEVWATDGGTARWTSRKARDLLMMLTVARGSPLPRATVQARLWPGADPAPLGNRLAVAVAAVRRALDPHRELPVQHFVTVDGPSIGLRADRLEIDAVVFLDLAAAADPGAAADAVRLYRGTVLPDVTAEWVADLRREVELAFCDVAQRVARSAAGADRCAAAASLYRRVIQVDPYNESAHRAKVAALTALGATARARAVREQLAVRQRELAPASRIVET